MAGSDGWPAQIVTLAVSVTQCACYAARQVPHAQHAVVTPGNDALAIRGDRHRDHEAGVTFQAVLHAAVG